MAGPLPVLPICAFTLGCVLIHAGRAHADVLTRVLTGATLLLAILVLFAAALACAPDDDAAIAHFMVYRAA